MTGALLLAALLGAVAGAAGALMLRGDRLHGWSRRSTKPPDPRPAPGPGPRDPLDAPLDSTLRNLATLLDARRLVLWRVDRTANAVRPMAATEDPPRPQSAQGDPLAWAAEQRQPLRLDQPPAWSDTAVLAIPVSAAGHTTVLTVEADDPPPADGAAGTAAASIMGAVIHLMDAGAASGDELERGRNVVAFLRELPSVGDAAAFPGVLARAAAQIAGQPGALVASYDGDAIEDAIVLYRHGEGDGPGPGTTITPGSDVALAIRARATIHRADRAADNPMASADERWRRRPRYTTIFPLADSGGRHAGALALWGHEPVDPSVVALIEALGPLLAVQLTHSLDLARYREKADLDPLTGLLDRGALDERLDLEARRFLRYRRPVALLVLDLDHFKAVNDTYGHPAGDAVLRRVAEILRATTRDPDIPARYGGEEMVVLLPETMLRQAADVADRIRANIEAETIHHDGTALRVTASIGVSACPECGDDPGRLMHAADEALYQAKRAGRNRVVTASPAHAGG